MILAAVLALAIGLPALGAATPPPPGKTPGTTGPAAAPVTGAGSGSTATSSRPARTPAGAASATPGPGSAATSGGVRSGNPAGPAPGHAEFPVPPPAHPVRREDQPRGGRGEVTRGNFRSVQVNVDSEGRNILGDAANEPSIAVDPTDPRNIVIGWRQFDTVDSDFRQAGMAYSHDGGETWTFPGPLDPGQFRSDPVLGADTQGVFYYYSLRSVTDADMFVSHDKGETWDGPIPAHGGDKTWIDVDQTDGPGRDNVYAIWNVQFSCCFGRDFTRSTDQGQTWDGPFSMPQHPKWGTVHVGPDGAVWVTGVDGGANYHLVLRSQNAQLANSTPSFDLAKTVDLGGTVAMNDVPNPGGLLGQTWIATDPSGGPGAGNVYVLSTVDPPGRDPADVHFIRSTDGGHTWSAPLRVNQDDSDRNWQWFGTMSVAPDGRIDVIWNDTRSDPSGKVSELYYAWSTDQGQSFSRGIPVSPPFDSTIGHPQQDKIGDYYDMVSDDEGAVVAYAATFNGEEDVWFVRVGDCNGNGRHDSRDLADGTSADCNGNRIPDECEPDCNGNGVADECDISAGTSPDCNGNGVPDECDVESGDSPDCDGDGVPDECTVTDDLETDTGWTAGADDDTATAGTWERVDPNGTDAQPEDDHTADPGHVCWVTGQSDPGAGNNDNDVDGGKTTLLTPEYDLAGMEDPRVGYWRWFSNEEGAAPGTDTFRVEITGDGGATWTLVEEVGPGGRETYGGWYWHGFRVADLVPGATRIRLRFVASDEGTDSVVEAAVDDFALYDCPCTAAAPGEVSGLAVTKEADGTTARFSWDAEPAADAYDLYRGSDPAAGDLACFRHDVPGTETTDDGALPAAGAAFFHDVAATNCAGEGPLGADRTPADPCP